MPKKKEQITVYKDGKIQEESLPKPKTANSRSRKFDLVTYIDRDSVISFLKKSEWVSHWAVCRHDRDINLDGSPKKVHTHILLYTYDSKTSSAVNRLFDIFSNELYRNTDTAVQNTIVRLCNDPVAYYRYLIHADDPDKAQYEVIERITDDEYYWRNLDLSAGMNSVDSNKALAMFDDYIAGVPMRDMLARYGQNFLMNYHKLKTMREDFYYESHYRKDADSIDEIIKNVLEDAVYPKAVVQGFFQVLDYLQSEILIKYNNVIDFYLRPSTKNDVLKK